MQLSVGLLGLGTVGAQVAERLLANRTDAMEIAQAQVELAQAIAQLQAIERLRKMKH